MAFWTRRLDTASLIEVCRSVRYSLTGGMMLRDVMDLLGREGTARVRPVAGRIAEDLKAGWSFQDALQRQAASFPQLFLALATVGEESGSLPEVMGELEKYYLMQQKLRRDFVSEITWPVVQLVASVCIIAGLIYVLGLVATRKGGEPIDALGLGLVGEEGAVTFLTAVTGAILVLGVAGWLAWWVLGQWAGVGRLLLYIPVLGPCIRAIALTRFCVALQLMLDTNLSVVKAFRLAFQATDNPAFRAVGPRAEASVRRGNTVTTALAETGVFPRSLVSGVAVAEESGRLPEMFRVQAENYDEEAKRRLTALNKLASGLIWLVVAGFIVLAIYRIFSTVYVQNLERVLPK